MSVDENFKKEVYTNALMLVSFLVEAISTSMSLQHSPHINPVFWIQKLSVVFKIFNLLLSYFSLGPCVLFLNQNPCTYVFLFIKTSNDLLSEV